MEEEMYEMKGRGAQRKEVPTHYLILQVLGDLVHLFGSQQDAASLLQGLNEADDAGLYHA